MMVTTRFFVLERVGDGAAHQALGAGGRNGLDADAGIEANLLARP